MLREPLLLPALAFVAGITVVHVHGPAGVQAAWATAVLAPLALGCWLWTKASRFRLAGVMALAAAAGGWTEAAHHETKRPKLNAEDGETLLLSGCVSNPPVFSTDRAQFTLDLSPTAAVRVTVNLSDGATLPLRYGERVETTAKMRSPRNFGNPGAFDYAGYLAAQHIYWTGSVASADQVQVVAGSCGSRAMQLLFDMRTRALARIRALYPEDPHTAGLLAATLLGETSGVEKQWTSDFRVTGTYHALVISGQHVSVLAGTLLLVLAALGMRRIPALGIAMAACWLYALISGFSAPVVRAAGAFTLFLVASYCFRRLRVLNVLALVGLVYLAFAPHQLFDPSFQLSFLSAAAIAVFAIPLTEKLTGPLRAAVKRFDQVNYATQLEPTAAQWRVELRLLAETLRTWTGLTERVTNRVMPVAVGITVFMLEAMVVSSCVQFGLALPMIMYFHRLSVTGLTANIIIIPVLSGVVPLGFLSLLTGWHPLAVLTRWLLVIAENVATWHARFEPAYRIAAIPLAAAVAFGAVLVWLAWTIRKSPRWVPVPLVAALAMFCVLCLQPWKAELRAGSLEVTAIDVGQGDSVLLAFPDGQTMLVDAGGFPGFGNMKRKPQMDIGEDVISPYLWQRHIRHLDYAVLTHGHSDHMGGLPAILDNFHPQALWVGAEPETDEWDTVRRHAAMDGTSVVALHRGVPDVDFGGARVRVVAPSAEYRPEENKPQNNDSLVLEVTYGKQRILLTGDAEAGVEAELVAAHALRPITLLKVGHHGSKTSSTEEFLSALQPQFAFISDGYKNQFHHPHPTVLARLDEHHVRIYRTDLQGLATFVTDGQNVEIKSFR